MTLRLSHSSELLGVEGDADDVSEGTGLEKLRIAPVEETLFLFPGGAGDPEELCALVAALEGSERVHTLDPDYGLDPVPSIEAIARRALDVIREQQPTGPYLLGGYSFGGLIALEVAQQLTAGGERVGGPEAEGGVALPRPLPPRIRRRDRRHVGARTGRPTRRATPALPAHAEGQPHVAARPRGVADVRRDARPDPGVAGVRLPCSGIRSERSRPCSNN